MAAGVVSTIWVKNGVGVVGVVGTAPAPITEIDGSKKLRRCPRAPPSYTSPSTLWTPTVPPHARFERAAPSKACGDQQFVPACGGTWPTPFGGLAASISAAAWAVALLAAL